MNAAPANDGKSVDSAKPIIGLIGGIGSGKSLVARQFADLGCAVIDADQLARDAYLDPAVREQIVQWWGKAVIKTSADGPQPEDIPDGASNRNHEQDSGTGGDLGGGELDRRKIAAIVFNNPDEKSRLEGLIHPRVFDARQALHKRYLSDPQVVAIVEDCPLLLEVGLDEQCDVLVFVDAPHEQRLARVMKTRGWDAGELDRREKNQIGLDKKADRADYVLKNDAGEAECFAHVRRVLSQILHN